MPTEPKFTCAVGDWVMFNHDRAIVIGQVLTIRSGLGLLNRETWLYTTAGQVEQSAVLEKR